jgi:hypothetical protein
MVQDCTWCLLAWLIGSECCLIDCWVITSLVLLLACLDGGSGLSCMVIGDEDGTCLDSGVDPVLKDELFAIIGLGRGGFFKIGRALLHNDIIFR